MIKEEKFDTIICIEVEINGRIVGFSNECLQLFDIQIQKGQLIEDIIPALYGYFPLTKERVFIENIHLNNFKGNIILLQENDIVKICFYENPKAMGEWQEKIQKHNQEELIKNIVMKTNTKALTCNVFYTLDFMIFEKNGDNFVLTGDIPNWFKLLFPNYNYSSIKFDLVELFPFLQVFEPEMDVLFGKNENGKVVSGLWTENSDNIDELILQATAVNDNGSNFLFLESISDRNPDKQKNLQKLREQTLILNQLKKTEDVLRNILKTREQFISIFSHDIKGPIGGVYSLMELLRNDKDFMSGFKDNQVHLIDVMYNDLKGLHEYSNKLYDWSNVNFGNMELEKTPTYLYKIFSDIKTNVRSKCASKSIKLKIDIPQDLSIKVDPVFFKNAVYNIVTNAIKFSNPLGIIEISTIEKVDFVQLSVKDYGVGIDKNMIESFSNFDDKISKSGTSGEKGTGIGLTIVQKILAMHNAKFSIKSDLGKGTEVLIQIPK
jgi:signal transduction histidine kinase